MSMADGYAQASGKLAVCNFHTTPGLGNALGMLYDAQKAGAPILLTAGQHEQNFSVTEPILWADLPPIARPLVKWSSEVHRLADLPRIIHRAAKTALAPPTGPVFVSLPGDILRADADIDLMAPTRIAPNFRGDRAAIEAAADCSHALSVRRSWPATSWRRAARTRSWSSLPNCSARRSMPSSCRTPRRIRHRIRCSAGKCCARRKGHGRRSKNTTCCFRSAPTCSRCRCRPTSIRCPPASRSFISTPIRGRSARTIRPRSRSSATPKARCRS